MRDWNDIWMEEKRADKQCPRCKEWWPASHLDTDSGDCITCEDSEEEEEEQDA